ncbi:MAG: FAD-binding protein [Desulfobacterales bacterium]|nr:FAD-binding protein [Desulfobacterales bacterium]
MRLARKNLSCDVLVVGGGLAGCMAAIRAGEISKPGGVLVVEKAHVRRSGNAATGIDHTWSFMPEVHQPLGYTVEQLVADHLAAMGLLQDPDIIHTVACHSQDRLKDLERWGFPVKTDGQWNYVKKIHRAPTFLHWAGRDQKVLFFEQLQKRRIRVLNRVMLTDLILQNGQVTGAIGVGAREPVCYVIAAKSVVLTTGGIGRLYPGPTSWEFNRASYPHNTGDGVAMALRVGAELVGMEYLWRHTGPKNFAKKGRGSWIGIPQDAAGKPIGKVREGIDRKKINVAVESGGDMIRAYRQGRGPVLMNCAETPDQDMDYMRWALENEGNVALLEYLKERHVDPKKYLIEFSVYEPEIRAGLNVDTRAATNIPGLFAAGDAIGNIKRGVSPAAFVMGWIAGESAAHHATVAGKPDLKSAAPFIKEKQRQFQRFLSRPSGASWKEAMAAVQDTMAWYGGLVRYDTLLRAGLHHLARVRAEALGCLKAQNLHELVHCVAALNLMDVGASSMHSSLARKETRMTLREDFKRVDYPEENPEMARLLVMKMKDGNPVFRWRDPRPFR